MPYVLIRHKVENYTKWKPIFDEHGGKRKASGSRGGRLFRNYQDPSELVILLEWDDMGKARKFTESEDLRTTMARAGVKGRPDIFFLDEIERVPV